MPMFEYRCGACGYGYEKYEAGRKAGHGTAEACPRCGKQSAERVFSTFSSNACGPGATPSGSSGGGCGHGGFS